MSNFLQKKPYQSNDEPAFKLHKVALLVLNCRDSCVSCCTCLIAEATTSYKYKNNHLPGCLLDKGYINLYVKMLTCSLLSYYQSPNQKRICPASKILINLHLAKHFLNLSQLFTLNFFILFYFI